MKVFKTEHQIVRVIADIQCDCCGNSLKTPVTGMNYCGIHFLVSGCYDSPIFPDVASMDEEVSVDVCEECASKWFATFKRNPLKEYE